MKKITTIFLLTTLLIFSGCSSGSFSFFKGSNNDAPEEDVTGTGLEVNFDIDKTFLGNKLNYRLEITNTGREDIFLTKNNINLTTLEMDSTGKIKVFTTKSIDKLLDNIFEEKEKIYLPQNAKLQGVSGQLEVSDWIFKSDSNILDFTYTLKIPYHTKTIFSNNLEIQKLEKTPLTVTDKLSQAAPVQITQISAKPFEDNIYYIYYKIQDKAKTNEKQYTVDIQNIEIKIGTKTLSDCRGFITENNNLKKLTKLELKNSQPTIDYICKVDFSEYSNTKTTTTTSGTFEYDYAHIQTETITLPTKRENHDIFE